MAGQCIKRQKATAKKGVGNLHALYSPLLAPRVPWNSHGSAEPNLKITEFPINEDPSLDRMTTYSLTHRAQGSHLRLGLELKENPI